MKKTITEINKRKKKLDGLATIGIFVLIILIILIYLIFLRKLQVFKDTFLTDIVSHIKGNITAFNLLGSFYVALFGGLFFIFVPMEAYYIKALANSNSILLYIVFILGIVISYTSDYIIGQKLSKAATKLISPKKFYSIFL